MEFCPDCGAMLLPNDNKLKCSCGYTKDLSSDNNEYSVSQKVKEKQGVVDMGEAEDLRSEITEICPECGHEHCSEMINSEFNRESVDSQYHLPFFFFF